MLYTNTSNATPKRPTILNTRMFILCVRSISLTPSKHRFAILCSTCDRFIYCSIIVIKKIYHHKLSVVGLLADFLVIYFVCQVFVSAGALCALLCPTNTRNKSCMMKRNFEMCGQREPFSITMLSLLRDVVSSSSSSLRLLLLSRVLLLIWHKLCACYERMFLGFYLFFSLLFCCSFAHRMNKNTHNNTNANVTQNLSTNWKHWPSRYLLLSFTDLWYLSFDKNQRFNCCPLYIFPTNYTFLCVRVDFLMQG